MVKALAENGITTAGLKALCEVLKTHRGIRKIDFSGIIKC